MSISFQTLDARFYARNPTIISPASIATVFFAVGITLVAAEALFFEYFAALARSSFTTRNIIGFHLFPSEIWFIFIGNLFLFLIVGNQGFLVAKYPFAECRPIFVILAVYSLWFIYGSLVDNSWALQEFREVVFSAFGLPPTLYFASQLDSRRLFEKFIVPFVLMLLVITVFGAHDSALMLGTFIVSYYILKLLFKNAWSLIGLGLVSLPFLFKFSKPMIALYAFCFGISFLLAAYLNQNSVNWILSKFKLRIAMIALTILIALLIAIAILNSLLGGAIEEIVRLYFLKERLTSSGQTIYADVSGGRFAIWHAAIDSWTQRPLFGYGLGAELEAYSSGWVTKVQYHSYVIQALHNTGLVGLTVIAVCWCTWLLASLRKVLRVRDTDEKILLGSMLAYVFGVLFNGLYGHSLSYPPSALFFWLCIGFLCALRHQSSIRVAK